MPKVLPVRLALPHGVKTPSGWLGRRSKAFEAMPVSSRARCAKTWWWTDEASMDRWPPHSPGRRTVRDAPGMGTGGAPRRLGQKGTYQVQVPGGERTSQPTQHDRTEHAQKRL